MKERVGWEGLGVSVMSAPAVVFLDMYESDICWKGKLLGAAVLGSAVATATLQSFRHIYNCVPSGMESPLVHLQ